LPKTPITEEVQVLRFFEEAPLDKAEMLFNIVKDKMRSRSSTSAAQAGTPRKTKERRPTTSSTEAGLSSSETGTL